MALNPTIFAPVLAVIGTLAGAAVATWGQVKVKRVEAELALQKTREDRQAEAEKTARKFREPLGRAAYDLQSRIYNIIRSDFLNAYLKNGDERTRTYAIKNTLFVIAQYFAWTELVRREIQFIDLGTDEKTRQLSALQDSIYSIWQTSNYHPLFRVFAGEQRAIGERILQKETTGTECLGYAGFLDFFDRSQDPLLHAVEADVGALGANLSLALPRLVALQHALVDLLDFLDPEFVRFPQKNRTKLEVDAS